MGVASEQYEAVIQAIDAANSTDPRTETVASVDRPREVLYSERMTSCMAKLYPYAPEWLRIAARAQHICRWQVPRDQFPIGRHGYNAWRAACREHHAKLTSAIMRDHGCDETAIANVVMAISKRSLKSDPDSQALENVVGVVFVEFYLASFVLEHAEYEKMKLIGILEKTFRKMDAVGHAAILALPLPGAHRKLVVEALTAAG